ncbi:MAG: AAA family ATPase [Candidatus Heimdallarchaeota archaeon]|nr:AAA family ATPase [Candidatus Heimdallarchaeota archaeon]
MKLLIIFGPQAVGKMTVGKELARRTGFKLIHNHISIEVAIQFFKHGSDEFWELEKTIRYKIFDMMKETGNNLIYTYTWALNLDSDHEYIRKLIDTYAEEVYFIELKAPLETRLKRNKLPDRLAIKPSKQNLELSEHLILHYEKEYIFNTNNDFPFPNHTLIDSDGKSVDEVVDEVLTAIPRFLG